MSDSKHKSTRRYPQEFPYHPEKYTEEIVAIDRIELGGPLELDRQLGLRSAGETFTDCHRFRQKKTQEIQKDQDAHNDRVRQDSDYREGNKAAPDNNLFFEERSNPLSSKGN